MSETVDVNPLVDQAAIKVASDRVLAALSRLTQAESDREAADQELDNADKALNDHLHDVGQGGAQADAKYLQAVNDATTQRDFKGRVVHQLLRVVAEEKDNLKSVTADAYAGLYQHGQDVRLAAAQKVDILRSALIAAAAEFRRGSQIVMRAYQSGAYHTRENVGDFIDRSVALGLKIETTTPGYSEMHERNLWGS